MKSGDAAQDAGGNDVDDEDFEETRWETEWL